MVTRIACSRPRQRGRGFTSFDREMNQLFGDFLSRAGVNTGQSWLAPANVWESEGHYHLELEMPGVSLDDVEITFDKGVLKIAAERKAPEEERNYWHQERSYGRVERSLQLPELADAESIDAQLADGLLTVAIAKLPEAQPKRINVRGS